MRTFLLLSMMLVASIAGAENKLTVLIDGIEKSEGKVLVAVYDSLTFLKQEPLYYGIAKVEEEQEEVTIEIEDVASGVYAIVVYHDANDNDKLDTGTFGIPLEKFGFSNNAMGEMGPPSFQDCMFIVEEDTEINITLIGT